MSDKAMKVVGGTVVMLALLVVLALARGAVLEVLWGWFVVPLGVPDIGLAHAVGIGLVVGFLIARPDQDERPFWEQVTASIIFNLLLVVFALAVGAIAHGYMG